MFRLPASQAFLALLLLGAPACSSAQSVAADSTRGPKTATPAGNDSSGPSITFLEPRLEFVPGDTRQVTAVVDPRGVYDVDFSLSGDFGDAFLDQSQVATSDDGTASATLTAPSSASTFTVRASVGTHNASLTVAVGTGFSDLNVVVHYAGHRTVSDWTATVRTGSNCHDLPGIPASDGPLLAEAAENAPLVVTGVPVGAPLTVTARAGHFVGGCADIDGAVPGAAQNSVDVTVLDRPMQMANVSASVELGIDDSVDSNAAWSAVANNLAQSFVAHAGTDATALLDSMLDGIPASPATARIAFRAARAASAWDSLLVQSLHDQLGSSGLHGLVSAWIRAAFPKLATAGIKATLTSKLGAGFASFNVSELGGFAASDVGLATNGGSTSFVGVTWNAAAGDQVLFGGAPKWPLSRLAASLALSPAQAQAKSATTVAGALAQVLSCDDVATLLTRSTGGTAYSDCGSACIRSLCERALDLMWTRAAYTPDDPTLVEFAAMATASVSDDAHPSTFAGTWVGSVRIGDDTDKIGGTAQGKP